MRARRFFGGKGVLLRSASPHASTLTAQSDPATTPATWRMKAHAVCGTTLPHGSFDLRRALVVLCTSGFAGHRGMTLLPGLRKPIACIYATRQRNGRAKEKVTCIHCAAHQRGVRTSTEARLCCAVVCSPKRRLLQDRELFGFSFVLLDDVVMLIVKEFVRTKTARCR